MSDLIASMEQVTVKDILDIDTDLLSAFAAGGDLTRGQSRLGGLEAHFHPCRWREGLPTSIAVVGARVAQRIQALASVVTEIRREDQRVLDQLTEKMEALVSCKCRFAELGFADTSSYVRSPPETPPTGIA